MIVLILPCKVGIWCGRFFDIDKAMEPMMIWLVVPIGGFGVYLGWWWIGRTAMVVAEVGDELSQVGQVGEIRRFTFLCRKMETSWGKSLNLTILHWLVDRILFLLMTKNCNCSLRLSENWFFGVPRICSFTALSSISHTTWWFTPLI